MHVRDAAEGGRAAFPVETAVAVKARLDFLCGDVVLDLTVGPSSPCIVFGLGVPVVQLVGRRHGTPGANREATPSNIETGAVVSYRHLVVIRRGRVRAARFN